MKTANLAAASLLAATLVECANADKFDLIFTPTNFGSDTANLLLTATNNMNGTYTVTNVAGQVDGINITSIANWNGSDNVLYFPNTQLFDFGGLAFEDQNSALWNLGGGFGSGLYGLANSVQDPSGNPPPPLGSIGTLSINSVPGPASMSMFGLLAVPIFLPLRKRSRRKASQQ